MTEQLRVFTKDDVKPGTLAHMTLAVVGYGSQGRAHAQNLRDSGLDVIIGARPGGKSQRTAEEDGFRVLSVAQAAAEADFIALTAPDMAHKEIFEKDLAPNMKSGATLMFAHGFSVVYNQVRAPAGVDVIMVAPKGPGDLVRREYQRGRGVPCLFAVAQDASGQAADKALAYADGIGGTAAAIFETTFRAETETDLFGEQVVLCGGVTELFIAAYETLVEAGYPKELAYYECFHELKLIVDLLHEGGLSKMYDFISETATFGDLRSGARVVGPEVKARMKDVLADIQNGTFAHDWVVENQSGKVRYEAMLRQKSEHEIEEIGARMRGMMTWLSGDQNNSGD
ncbi:MAG: ketol-acid reductoisomerase [Pseudomonadota bacterium]